MAPGGQGALIDVCNGKAPPSASCMDPGPRHPSDGDGAWEGSCSGPAGHRQPQRRSCQEGKLRPRGGGPSLGPHMKNAGMRAGGGRGAEQRGQAEGLRTAQWAGARQAASPWRAHYDKCAHETYPLRGTITGAL